MRRIALALSLLLIIPIIASAEAMNPLDFAKGPEQWLFTAEDRRAWRDVKTAEQAQEFIDLFWARRDPTPGTPLNEFRTELQRRISFADASFGEGKKRGALTERGRVLILLGFPKTLASEAQKRSSQFAAKNDGPNPLDPTGGRAQAAKDVWEYTREDALKYGMPKIEVVFVHDGFGDTVRRDPQRMDFSTALPAALKYPIVSPELTEVPDWARSRGVAMVAATPAEEDNARPAEAGPDVISGPAEAGPTSTGPTSASPTPLPVVSAKPAGAGRLTLVEDAFEIEPQNGADPFASLRSLSDFKRSSELGWAAEYCTGNASSSLDLVKVGLKISGLINGERQNYVAPEDELAPDSIKSSPGCYLVRGAVPLSEMDPGTYDLNVTLADAQGGRTYNLSRQFKVE